MSYFILSALVATTSLSSLCLAAAPSRSVSREEVAYDDYEEEEQIHATPRAQPRRAVGKKNTARARPLADPGLLSDNAMSDAAPVTQTVEENTSFLSIAPTYSYLNLHLDKTGSFNGSLGGFQALYEFRPCNSLYESLKLSWQQGNTTHHNDSLFLVDVQAEERIGYTFATNQNRWLWTMFSGFGYRFLGHHLKESGQSPLRLRHNEFYVPVGLFSDYQFYHWFSFGIHATWMPQVFPTLSSTGASGLRWATTCELANVLIETPFNFFMGHDHQFFITFNPRFQYWQDGKAKVVDIPANTYLFWGFDLNLGYAF